jgi:hypothetical protein
LRNSAIFAATLARMPSAPIVSTNAESMNVSFARAMGAGNVRLERKARCVPLTIWKFRTQTSPLPKHRVRARERAQTDASMKRRTIHATHDLNVDGRGRFRLNVGLPTLQHVLVSDTVLAHGGSLRIMTSRKRQSVLASARHQRHAARTLCRTPGLPALPGDLGLKN